MADDSDIPMGVKYPSSDPLRTVDTYAQLQNRLNQNRLFQATFGARNAMGELAQQAVDPQTGQLDYDKFGQLISTDPRTAFMAPEMLNQFAQRRVQQQQLAGLQLDQTAKILDMGNNLFASAAASKDPRAYIDAQLPALFRLAPQGTQRGVFDNLRAYRMALEDLPDDQLRDALRGHAAQAKMTSDALGMIYGKGGMSRPQLNEPTKLQVSPEGAEITGTREQFLQQAGGGGGGTPTLQAQTAQAESGGNLAARNPNSSATGKYQFTAGTWADVMRRHPELPLTPEGRLDEKQQDIAYQANAQDNGMALSRAGLPATDQNISLAHRYGAAGATAILQAPPNTPVEKVLSRDAVEANGLAGMKTGDLVRTVPQGQSGGGNASAPGVQTTLGPVREQGLKNFTEYEKELNGLVQGLRPLAIAMQVEREAASRFQMGGGAEVRADIAKLLQGAQHAGATFITDDFINKVANGSIADTQTFKAAMTPLIMGQYKAGVKDTGRGFVSEFQGYQEAYPHPSTDPGAYEAISNMIARQSDLVLREQASLQQYKKDIRSGKVKGNLEDFPAVFSKQLQDEGQIAFPQIQGVAKRPGSATPAPTKTKDWDFVGGKLVPKTQPQ